MSPVTPQRDLSLLTRPSGAFAMLAVDQREAMRNMFAEHQQGPVADEQVTSFKLAAARILSKYASGVLVDKQFAFDRVVEEQAVAPGCGLIAAADHFIPAHGEVVGEVQIDPAASGPGRGTTAPSRRGSSPAPRGTPTRSGGW